MSNYYSSVTYKPVKKSKDNDKTGEWRHCLDEGYHRIIRNTLWGSWRDCAGGKACSRPGGRASSNPIHCWVQAQNKQSGFFSIGLHLERPLLQLFFMFMQHICKFRILSAIAQRETLQLLGKTSENCRDVTVIHSMMAIWECTWNHRLRVARCYSGFS